MQAEIVTIGTELLLGEIVDTNAAYLSRQLNAIGIDVYYRTTVGDNEARIAAVIRQALARADVVITSGGLGPTVDDVTRQGVARATDRELVFVPELWAHIQALFRRWGREAKENNRRQAYIPAGAIPVHNPVGTAPAFIVETERGTVISLPGVPREMEYLMEHRILPYLRERLPDGEAVIKSKILRTCGVGESTIDRMIEDLMRSPNPTVGLAAHPGQTDVRITAKADTPAQAEAMIAAMEAKVRERLGVVIYGEGQETLEEVVARLLKERGYTIAVVETNTGGLIARRLLSTPEGEKLVRGSMVIGEEEAADEALGLPESYIAEHGLASPRVAAAAADAIRTTLQADLGLAVLGTTQSEQDLYAPDTGVTYVALSTPTGPIVRHFPYGGTSDLAQQWVSTRALDLVRRYLLGVSVGRLEG